MKKKKPTRAQAKNETREALVTAALALFAARGFDAPSLDDICEHAGFTRGAFYVHFADRDDLVTAVMQRVGRAFLDGLLGQAGEDDDLATIAQRFIASIASGSYPLMGRGGIRPYQLLDACARSPAIRAQYVSLVQETIARLNRAAMRAQRKHQIRKNLDTDGVGFLLVTAVIGVQTLMDLEVPVDVAKSASWMLKLLR